MDLGKLSYWSRRIHRLSLWFVMISGLIQMITGLTQKYTEFFSFIDLGIAISVHTFNSIIFVFFFLISMITGLIMYVTPWLIKHLNRPPKSTNLPN
jgi:cytochrome b subunit of formate dehydrogenase